MKGKNLMIDIDKDIILDQNQLQPNSKDIPTLTEIPEKKFNKLIQFQKEIFNKEIKKRSNRKELKLIFYSYRMILNFIFGCVFYLITISKKIEGDCILDWYHQQMIYNFVILMFSLFALLPSYYLEMLEKSKLFFLLFVLSFSWDFIVFIGICNTYENCKKCGEILMYFTAFYIGISCMNLILMVYLIFHCKNVIKSQLEAKRKIVDNL